jgi:hypothetical protein
MIDLIDRRDLDDSETATTSMIELIDCRGHGCRGTTTTSMIDLIDRRDLDDPGNGTDVTAVDLIARRQPSVLETPVTSHPIDH